MPYATNPVDGSRTYLEDSGSGGAPVLFYTGFADPLEVAKASRLAQALSGPFRLIFADHRGQGWQRQAPGRGRVRPYRRVLPTPSRFSTARHRARAFVGSSWGARLGFALGEHAPKRLLSLVLCGNQPYAWDLGSATARAVAAAIAASRREVWAASCRRSNPRWASFSEPDRTWTLERNDPAALEAAWRSVELEGPSPTTSLHGECRASSRGQADEMHDGAKRAPPPPGRAGGTPGPGLLSFRPLPPLPLLQG